MVRGWCCKKVGSQVKYVALVLGAYSFVIGAWLHTYTSLGLGVLLGSLLTGVAVMLFATKR